MSSDEPSITRAFAALEPQSDAISRMRDEVWSRLESSGLEVGAPPSLAAEWLQLLKARPAANTLWVAAALAALMLTSPLAALPLWLLG